MEIAPNVHRVTVGEGAFVGVYAPNVYLVKGESAAAFIDTAYGKDGEIETYLGLWESLGKPRIDGIVLTHRHGDHVGGAARLQKATGGEITCSAAEGDAIEQELGPGRIGRRVGGGDTLDLGGATIEFIPSPGHTLGSLCVFYREEGVLFTGDTVLGSGATTVSPEHGDMALYIESLRKLVGYEARMIGPGHGPIINQPRRKLEGLIEHRLARERQILDLILGGRRTIEELFVALYSELDRRLHGAARSQIRSHLIKLEREGKVAREHGDAYTLRP